MASVGMTKLINQAFGGQHSCSPGVAYSYAMHIINSHGVLVYLHVYKQDYRVLEILLLCKFICEQAVDSVDCIGLADRVRRGRAAASFVMAEAPESKPSLLAERQRSNSMSPRYPSASSAVMRASSNSLINSPDQSQHTKPATAGEKNKKGNTASRLFSKIRGRSANKLIDPNPENDNESSERMAQFSASPVSPLRQQSPSLMIDSASSNTNSAPPSRRRSSSGPSLCGTSLLLDHLKHRTSEEFKISESYSKTLILHGYLAMFSGTSPLFVCLIFLQLLLAKRTEMFRAAMSIRSPCLSRFVEPADSDIPDSLSKAIDKAKATDATHPRLLHPKETSGLAANQPHGERPVEVTGKLTDCIIFSVADAVNGDAVFASFLDVGLL